MEPFIFEWKMPLTKYKECKVKERLWSISYTTPQYLPLKFYLRLFPHGDDEENSEFISYFLFCEPPNNQTITLIYNLYIQDETGRRIAESPWEGEFGVKHQTWGKRRFCRRPIISAGSDDNRFLTFGCKVEVKDFDPAIFVPKKIYPSVPIESEEETTVEVARHIQDDSNTFDINVFGNSGILHAKISEFQKESAASKKSSEDGEDSGLDNKAADGEIEEEVDDEWSDESKIELETAASEEEPKPKVLSKLGGKIAALYPTMEISDVTLCVGGEDIKAHKLILFLHSPCLAAMIKQDEWDSASTKIDIEGFAPLTVQKALEFMYTETIAAVEELAVAQMMELSRFATMFTISDLKEFINAQLISAVNISTACELANLSSTYNEDVIHQTALEFITKNLQAVKLDDTFVQLSGENAMAVLRML